MKTVLKNGYVLTAGQLRRADVLIDAGVIQDISPEIPASQNQFVSVAGQVILPGFVDVHVHFREPGYTDKETIATGSLAAAHGGYTTVFSMPNVQPVPDTPQRWLQMQQLNQQKGCIHIQQYASITRQRTGNELVDFKALKQVGACGFSNDGSGVQTAATMYQAMQAAAQVHLPIAAHIEDDSLAHGGVMNAGLSAQKLHLPGIPAVSETAQLARDLELAAATGVHYHACHLSTAASVELVRAAKKRGVNVTAEVTPHHLLLDESMITTDNPLFKMNPPLRTLADRQALLSGLLDGTIDCIATDHAPHTKLDKQGSMLTAAFGITGLETSFAVLYTSLVQSNLCSLAQLVNWMSTQPARIFHLKQAGRIAIGAPADLTVVDLNHWTTITAAEMLSKGKNSPFIGRKVAAQIKATMVHGQWVYQQEAK